MRLMSPTSIRRRLLLISAAITLSSLTLAGILFVANDVHMLRSQMARDLEILSVVVGDNCLSALVFDAPESAEKNLASLRREQQIRYAVLYDAEGRPFARYRRDAEQQPRDPAAAGEGVFVDISVFGLGSVDVVRELVLDGRSVGRIFIHARMDELAAQLRGYVGMVGLLFLVALSLSLLLAMRLQRRVTDPILQLAAKTREISEQANYALRVPEPELDDEIAALFRGFNAMLEQIERHEQDLTHIRGHLAQLVEERTQALDAVVREQRLIMEALPLGVILLVGRRIMRVNPRAAEVFGWDAPDMLGLSTEYLHPNRAAFEEVGRVGYARMVGGEIYRDDRILQRKDGSRFWARLIGQYIDPTNTELGSIWMVDDIDRDKALEDGLRQAREVAEKASRAKDAFLANMSHELRTPLNSVLGFAQLLEADGRLDAGQRGQVEGIRRGGDRLLGLINEVLDLAKIEANRLDLVPVEWDSTALLQEVGAMFLALARGKGIEMRIEPAADLPPRLRCDAKRLHQVLVNLIDNAVKYTHGGTVTLHAGFADGMLTFAVNDTGMGIAAAEIEHIFEPFRQVGETQGRPQGTGLGLAIAKRLVERMGGSISVETAPGRGSTFRVHIPARPVAPGDGNGAAIPAPASIVGYRRGEGRGPLRILIVDDERDNREILRGLLEPLGFAVREAENGAVCGDQAVEWRPDLILMDLRMPDMDGLAATRALRHQPMFRRTPIVAVTAAAFEDDRAKALEAGCSAHLPKPVLREALVEALGALLPLEWVRGEEPASDVTTPDIEALAPADRLQLRKLVRAGNVKAIGTLVEELAQQGCSPALTQRLSRLADAFDIAALRRLVEGVRAADRVDGAHQRGKGS